MRLGINRQPHVLLLDRAEQRIHLRERFNLISPQFDPVGHVVVGREDLNHVAAHAKRSPAEVAVRALVEDIDQLARDVLALDLLALLEKQHHPVVRFRRSQAVDAAHRRNNQRIAALKQRTRRRQPQLVEFIVDGRFFFDIKISRRNVRLRLVVVVIGDEIFDRIVRKEVLELVVKLRRQRLVMRHHQRWTVHRLDHLRHGERLARPGDAEQNLVLLAVIKPAGQRLDGGRLIALRFVAGNKFEIHEE